MKDYFFNSYPRDNFNRSKSQANLINVHRPSLFNLSGENIVYNKNNRKKRSVKTYLKNDNLLAHKKLDEIKDEYNNMRNFLNDKVSRMEEQQRLQFESLRNYLEANNRIDEKIYEDKYRNNLLNEIKEQMYYDMNQKKEHEKLRNIEIEEKLGERRYMEEKERKNLLREMNYFKKVQHINRLERMLQQKNRMNKYYQFNSPFLSQIFSPLLFDYFNRNNSNQKQDELMKLILLKNILGDDKPKRDHPIFHRAPKYFIQKYYPPNQPTKLIPVPQPVFINNPEPEHPPSYQQPNIIIQREPKEIITPHINIVTRDARPRKKTEKKSTHKSHKHKHNHHKHKHKHTKKSETPKSTKKKTESETEESSEEEDEEDEEDDDDEDDKEKPEEEKKEETKPEEEKKEEKKEEDDESSSQPDVRLKLVDPDNPQESRYVYPVNNQQ